LTATATTDVSSPGCVVDAWRQGPARKAGPLTGFRLFDRTVARRVPRPGRKPVVQIHVTANRAGGHRTVLAELGRHRLLGGAELLPGVGVASHLVGPDGLVCWAPAQDPATVVAAGAPGTATPSVGLVLGFADAERLRRAWGLLDELCDTLYGQQVLDRSAHVPARSRPPASARRVDELHLIGRDGRRLVHLGADLAPGSPVWVPARPHRFDLHDWITWPGAGAELQ